MNAQSILFICSGNTCRSPMAEVLLRHQRPDLQVSSAGVAAQDGEMASLGARHAAERLDLDLSEHRARLVRPELLERADQVVCMTEGHRQRLLALYPHHSDRLAVLRPLAGLSGDVADPYGQDLETYLLCARDLQQALGLAFAASKR